MLTENRKFEVKCGFWKVVYYVKQSLFTNYINFSLYHLQCFSSYLGIYRRILYNPILVTVILVSIAAKVYEKSKGEYKC